MKNYGMNKATEFTKKQISCLYGAAKRGELKIEKWIITEFYDLADYYGYDDNRSVEEAERDILAIINSYFEKDGNTQKLIDDYTAKTYALLGAKRKDTVDRRYIESKGDQ